MWSRLISALREGLYILNHWVVTAWKINVDSVIYEWMQIDSWYCLICTLIMPKTISCWICVFRFMLVALAAWPRSPSFSVAHALLSINLVFNYYHHRHHQQQQLFIYRKSQKVLRTFQRVLALLLILISANISKLFWYQKINKSNFVLLLILQPNIQWLLILFCWWCRSHLGGLRCYAGDAPTLTPPTVQFFLLNSLHVNLHHYQSPKCNQFPDISYISSVIGLTY